MFSGFNQGKQNPLWRLPDPGQEDLLLKGRETEQGWSRCRWLSVSPNNSSSEKKSWSPPVPPVDRWSAAWGGRLRTPWEVFPGEGSAAAPAQVRPHGEPPTPDTLEPYWLVLCRSLSGLEATADACASNKSGANSNVGKRGSRSSEAAEPMAIGGTLWIQETQNTRHGPATLPPQKNNGKVNSWLTGRSAHTRPSRGDLGL